MAIFVQHMCNLARLGVDCSGQSGDAVDVAAAVGEAVAERLLDTAAVALDGFGERAVHFVRAAVNGLRRCDFQ